MVTLSVNGRRHDLDIALDTPLLWALRDALGLTGTKYGCGIAQCGACTVHLDGKAVRSCVLPVSAAEGKEVTTIEGLSEKGDHPLQRAWIAEEVPQCGFCQSGQLMAAAALLAQDPAPNEAAIEEAMKGVLCRCGSYQRVRRAIERTLAERARGLA